MQCSPLHLDAVVYNTPHYPVTACSCICPVVSRLHWGDCLQETAGQLWQQRGLKWFLSYPRFFFVRPLIFAAFFLWVFTMTLHSLRLYSSESHHDLAATAAFFLLNPHCDLQPLQPSSFKSPPWPYPNEASYYWVPTMTLKAPQLPSSEAPPWPSSHWSVLPWSTHHDLAATAVLFHWVLPWPCSHSSLLTNCKTAIFASCM